MTDTGPRVATPDARCSSVSEVVTMITVLRLPTCSAAPHRVYLKHVTCVSEIKVEDACLWEAGASLPASCLGAGRRQMLECVLLCSVGCRGYIIDHASVPVSECLSVRSFSRRLCRVPHSFN